MARDQLDLARPEADSERQGWEARNHPATPPQVRRGMGRILALLGTPRQADASRDF